MEQILDLVEKPIFDESISSYEYCEFMPTTGQRLNQPSEIYIEVFGSDEFFHPHSSFILFEGAIMKPGKDGPEAISSTSEVSFCNLGVLHLFRLIQYSISGNIIESIYQPGIASLMKKLIKNTSDDTGLLSMYEKDTSATIDIATNDGFNQRYIYTTKSPNPPGSFSIIIYLRDLFGYFEDFSKVTTGLRQTLKLVRTNDMNGLMKNAKETTDFQVIFDKISLFQPIVKVNDEYRYKLYDVIKSKQRLEMCFNEHSLESIQLPQQKDYTWSLGVKSNRPQYLIFAFQVDRDGAQTKNISLFDHIKIRNYYVMLNERRYPTKDFSISFEQMKIAQPYKDLLRFYNNYYGVDSTVANLNLSPLEYSLFFPSSW